MVDINFIGHSRGTVGAVSEALQTLAGTTDPALRGGYMQMTLLDPHPANNLYGHFSAIPNVDPVDQLAGLVILFQGIAQDPQVVVYPPSNVMQVQDFYEQTPAGQFLFLYLNEILLNLWGEATTSLPNQSAQPIESRNLTNVIAPGIGRIGHSEVHDWYMANVVDTNETFTFFG